ncbi:MAG: hypothetical protein SFZ24_00320 [Planctomycetota bacterium]|nr:hypothetical protein [Planctomycetota bacterium]
MAAASGAANALAGGAAGAASLAQSWEVLSAGAAHLRRQPEDHGRRLAVVAAAARVGLSTMAREEAARLPAGALPEESRGALAEALAKLPDDRVPTSMVRETCRANVEALAGRGVDVRAGFERWERTLGERGCFRAFDGNVVRRAGDGSFGPLSDVRGAAARATRLVGPAGELTSSTAPAGVIVQGLETPWILLRAVRDTPGTADGYECPVVVFAPDESAMLDGLASADLREVIAEERVLFFVGAGAHAELERWLAGRRDAALPRDYLLSGCGAADERAVGMLRSAQRRQQDEAARLTAEVEARYAGRDARWWGARLAEARSDGGPALRVLIPISRYSTFVRHAAADLAEALRGAGVDARVLTEPDCRSRLVTTAYLRAFAEWEPDVVVAINHARPLFKGAVPAGVPVVCWIQDRMQHLFSREVGRGLGPLDFVIGHLHPELFASCEWPAARRRFLFVPASSRTFHSGPVEAGLAVRVRCDVAYVSHQSESPEAAHARLRGALAGRPELLRVADEFYEWLVAGSDGGAGRPRESVRLFITERLKTPKRDPRASALVDALMGAHTVPLAERFFRHEALEWAAEMARRRGWRLRLFGKGWESHPRLAEFAAGPLEHDEQLRALYFSAGVNLHVSRNSNAHQRMYECALSGGLMLRRGPSPDAWMARWALADHLLRRGSPVGRTADGDRVYELQPGGWPDAAGFAGDDLAGLEMTAGGGARVVIPEFVESWIEGRELFFPLAMLPDQGFPAGRETLFASAAELERLIERALSDGGWRAGVIDAQRAHALRHCTFETVARETLELLAQELPAGASCAGETGGGVERCGAKGR